MSRTRAPSDFARRRAIERAQRKAAARISPGEYRRALNPNKAYPLSHMHGLMQKTVPHPAMSALGRYGAFGVPGRPPRLPYRITHNPQYLSRANAAMGRLGWQLAKIHPAVRYADLAFNFAYELYDPDVLPWGIMAPEQEAGEWDFGPEWTQCCNVSGTDVRYRMEESHLTCQFGPSCGSTGHVPTGNTADLTVIPANMRTFALGRSVLFGTRMTWDKHWWRPPSPNNQAVGLTEHRPPIAMPVPRAEPAPAVISERMRNFDRFEYARQHADKPFYSTMAITIPIWSGGYMDPRIRHPNIPPPRHPNMPPGRGERERKTTVQAMKAAKFLAALYEGTAAANQFTNALYRNLGRKCPGAKSMAEKANCIYRNLDSLNVRQAMADMLALHFYRNLAGRVFEPIGKMSPFGIMTPGTGAYRKVGQPTRSRTRVIRGR